MGSRVGRALEWDLPAPVRPDRCGGGSGMALALAASLVDVSSRAAIRAAMSRHVGVLRSADSLRAAAATLDAVPVLPSTTPSRDAWESTNLLTVASAMVAAAARRLESRGCHRRSDYPEAVDEWVVHLDVVLDGPDVRRLGDDRDGRDDDDGGTTCSVSIR
jgi:L-aspartate oxidase